jgi:hypothetical protein
MKRMILFLVLFSMAGIVSTASAATVAYWRFGDGEPNAVAEANLPDSDAWTIWREAVHDKSGNGNHLTTWDYAFAGFNWRVGGPNVPATTVPSTGASNNWSMQNAGNSPAAMTWSSQSHPTGIDINNITPYAFTVEASFKFDSTPLGSYSVGFHTFVGRDDYNVVTGQILMASLYFSARPGAMVAIQFADKAGNRWDAVSDVNAITNNRWYNMVGVSDGSTLKLYLDDVETGKGSKLVAQTDISASTDPRLAKGNASGTDWQSGTWTVGRGLYNSGHVDRVYGWIDEVRISDTALKLWQFLMQQRATDPTPADAGSYGGTNVTLKWFGAIAAKKHDVYFSDNFNDVNNATPSTPTIYKGRQDANSYYVSSITTNKTYYWRIDEVNGVQVWKGNVWSFFVNPNQASNPTPYDNEICVFVDPNTILSWTAGATAKKSLVYLGTTPGTLVLDANILHTPGVSRYRDVKTGLANDQDYYWRVDEVNTTTYTGNVWHFKTIPIIPITDPHLKGWWPFDEGQGKAIDWSGLNQHGTLYSGGTQGPPQYVTGYDGGAMKFSGQSGCYISLPIGTTISNLHNATIASWVNWTASTSNWQRIFDFGKSSATGYMFLTPRNGANATMRFAITKTSNGGESMATAPQVLPTGWHHVAVVIDGDNGLMSLYLDAVAVVDEVATTTIPSDLGVTTQNWLGRSQWPDPYLNGMLDNFVIYDYAMTQEEIKHLMASKQASLPNPPDNGTEVGHTPTLTWEAGFFAASVNGHKLYFADNFSDVNTRTVTPVTLTDPCYHVPPPALTPLKTYYWVVDEVNGSNTWKGNVWRFTTRSLDAFESYTATGSYTANGGTPPEAGTLRRTWIDGLWPAEWFDFPGGLKTPGSSGSYAQLNTDTHDDNTNKSSVAQGGTKSMKLYYDNDGTITWLPDLYGEDSPYYNYTAPKYSEVSAAIDNAARLTSPNPPFDPAAQDSLDIERDWSGYKLLRVSVYGDPNNTLATSERFYVGLRDADGTEVTLYNSDPNTVRMFGWRDWYIPLSDFTAQNANLDLHTIARIYMGIGIRGNNTTSGGKGAVFVDNMQLLKNSICVPGSVIGDFTADCNVNSADLRRMTELWLAVPPTAPTGTDPNILLDASTLTLGPLTSWTNAGKDGGKFDANLPDLSNRPKVEMVDGRKAVTFDSNDVLIWDHNTPAVTGTNNHPFTVIYEVWNAEVGADEELFCWAPRNTTARYAAVGFGTDPTWGAAQHWDAGYDMGFDRGVPSAHAWHTIAVTKTHYGSDPNMETIVVDGQINAREAKTLNTWSNVPVMVGAPFTPRTGLPRKAWNRGYAPYYAAHYNGSVSKIEFFGYAMTPAQLAMRMGSPVDMNKDNIITFKDLAIFAKNWMLGPVLFP